MRLSPALSHRPPIRMRPTTAVADLTFHCEILTVAAAGGAFMGRLCHEDAALTAAGSARPGEVFAVAAAQGAAFGCVLDVVDNRRLTAGGEGGLDGGLFDGHTGLSTTK